MDGFDSYASQTVHHAGARDEGPGAPRSFLFLQAPISGFFDRLGRALIARGHRVHKVNLHLGDRLFWRLPAIDYRGRLSEWRDFVADLLDRHQVTDLLLHGDRRPYHIVAAEEARARGIAVIATDLGYVRPDWLTLEYDGMSSYSRFPRDAAAIRALAAEFPEPNLAQRFQNPFGLIALFDIAYNLGLVFGRALYPHYRYHSVCHPFAEYAGWILSRPKKLLTAHTTAAAKQRLQEAPGTYFLVPLQLQTDFQIRAHSPYDDLRDAVREVVASFAASRSQGKLVFIIHPLDNGLIGWHRLIARLAEEHGVADRVMALHGGTPTALVRNAAGIVTVNSTVGLAALYFGVPVKVLGNAVFDVAGLTCQEPLAAFWQNPRPPEPELLAAFLRALVGATQVKGGYYERSSQECAVAGFIERLEWRPYPLEPPRAAAWPRRAPRPGARKIAVAGVAGSLGVALARACAVPGVQLYLIGHDAETLATAADDCRQRGALVETCRTTGGALSPQMQARMGALDELIVHGEGADGFGGGEPDMDAVSALAEPMCRRGRGSVALVSGRSGRAGVGDPAGAAQSARAWIACGETLRRRLQPRGIAVTVAHENRLAAGVFGQWLGPPLAAATADRVAELTLNGMRRGRSRIAIPGSVAILTRALRLTPFAACQAVAAALRPSAAGIVESVEDAPLTSEPATGDRVPRCG